MLLRAGLTVLLLIHGLSGSTADQDVAATRSLTELLGRINTFTANFEQEITDTRGYVLETQKGTMGSRNRDSSAGRSTHRFRSSSLHVRARCICMTRTWSS